MVDSQHSWNSKTRDGVLLSLRLLICQIVRVLALLLACCHHNKPEIDEELLGEDNLLSLNLASILSLILI